MEAENGRNRGCRLERRSTRSESRCTCRGARSRGAYSVQDGKAHLGCGAEDRCVLTNPTDRERLGVECKYQGVQGSAEEKIPSTIQDIEAWPIKGIVVFAGEGLSANMRAFLLASGKVVHLEDLKSYLQLFFGLPI